MRFKVQNLIKSRHKEIGILFLFVVLSLIFTYPLIFRMGSCIYGYGGDSAATVYSLWRMKYTWGKGMPYYFNALVASPFGVDFSGGIQSLPLVKFFGKWLAILTSEVLAYNLIILLSFPLTGITMYYLVHHLTKNKVVSLVSGIIFAFCPYHLTHSWAHLSLSNIQWMPLYVLTLFKLDENRSYVNALLCALAFCLNALSDPHYGYFMGVCTVAFLLFKLLSGWRPVGELLGRQVAPPPCPLPPGERAPKATRRGEIKARGIKVGLVAVVVALAIILPFHYRALKTAFLEPKTEAIASMGYVRPFKDLFYKSAKPLNYFLPAVEHPLLGKYTRRFLGSIFYGRTAGEHTLYLGCVPVLLSLVAIRNWRKRRKKSPDLQGKPLGRQLPVTNRPVGSGHDFIIGFFIFAGMVAFIFSQPPYWQVGPLRIPFPSYFMHKILPMVRVYARFGIVVMLSVSVLAGIGLANILSKIANRKSRIAITSLLIGLVLFEFWNWPPYRVTDVSQTPAVYEWLAKRQGDFAIAEYPLTRSSNHVHYEYLFWQRIHQKPMVNGAMPGTYAEKIRKSIIDIADPETPGVLAWLGAKYVIFHPDKYLKEKEAIAVIGEIPDVSQVEGLKLIKKSEDVKIYEVVAQLREPK